MIDFILRIFSSVLQMNMRDHHDIPFALPLMLAIFGGGLIGYIIVRLIPEQEAEGPELSYSLLRQLAVSRC